jgi:hypothetical protein
MRDYLDLSPTPVDEPCAKWARVTICPECELSAKPSCHQLERPFPRPWPLVLAFAFESNAHEFGIP